MNQYAETKLVCLGEGGSFSGHPVRPAPWPIARRGIDFGWVGEAGQQAPVALERIRQGWHAAEPVMLAGFLGSDLGRIQGHVEQSERLVEKILAGQEPNELVDLGPYSERLAGSFELVSSLYDENDDQEIEKLEFQAVQEGRTIAEDVWMKVAWLSFFDDDASLRFRFSFGMENYEDVAADLLRERVAARLCDAIFPESGIITENRELKLALCGIIGVRDVEYVERIVYFNAPQGGAQFHHDVERGHLGVIFAQLTGRTAWLALSTQALLAEMRSFLECPLGESVLGSFSDTAIADALGRYRAEPEVLRTALNDPNDEAIEVLLNRTPEFFAQLVRNGHGFLVQPGDVLLLPQQGMDHCAWHSVYCLGEEMGEGLSFAIREVA